MQRCTTIDFDSFATSTPALLNNIGVAEIIASQPLIVIKPNLVNMSEAPVTLPVDAARAIVAYCQEHSEARIIIAEGTGIPDCSTWQVFNKHGYDELATERNVELLDLNDTELVKLSNSSFSVFAEFMMPKIIMESFIISAATLKAHSLARVTLSMKNMIGVAPPTHYQCGGYWRKSAFHQHMQRSIFELNCYRKPDLAFIDASIGLAEQHLGGPICMPPVRKLIAGADAVAVDACGAGLLGIDWEDVGHIKMADGVIGTAGKATRAPDS